MFGSRAKREVRRTDMKKTAKKNPSNAPQKKASKDLDVKRSKGGEIRGGCDGSSKDPLRAPLT
jgi:hypothetical protein